MENLGDRISITCFVDPHNFCFTRYIDNVERRNIVEDRIEELVKNNQVQRYETVEPFYCGTMKYLKLNRYIRIEVLKVYERLSKDAVECLVWAMDYGYPIRTVVHYLWELPDELTESLDLIRWAGVANVFPASMNYDFLSQEKHLVEEKEWPRRLCERLEVSFKSAMAVFFKEVYNLKGHRWGELTIMSTLGTFSYISQCLVDSNEALLDVKDFRSKVNGYTNLYEIVSNSTIKFERNDLSVKSRSDTDDLSVVRESSFSNNLCKKDEWQKRNRNSLKSTRSEISDSDNECDANPGRVLKEKNQNTDKESHDEHINSINIKDLSADAYFALNENLPFESNSGFGFDTMSNYSEVSLKSYASSFLEKRRLDSIRLNREKNKPRLKQVTESLRTSSENPNSKRRYVSKPGENCDVNKNLEEIMVRQKTKQREQIEEIRQSYFPAQMENGIDGFKRIYPSNFIHIPAGIPPEPDFPMRNEYKFDSDFMSRTKDFTASKAFQNSNPKKRNAKANNNLEGSSAVDENSSKSEVVTRASKKNSKKCDISDSQSELDEFFIRRKKTTDKVETQKQKKNESKSKARVVSQAFKKNLNKSDIPEIQSELDVFSLSSNKSIERVENPKQKKNKRQSKARVATEASKKHLNKSDIQLSNSIDVNSPEKEDIQNQKRMKKGIKSKNSDISETVPIQTELDFYLNIYDSTNVGSESQEPLATSSGNEDENERQLDKDQYIKLLNTLENSFTDTSSSKIFDASAEEKPVNRKSIKATGQSFSQSEKRRNQRNDCVNVKESVQLMTGITTNKSQVKAIKKSVDEANKSTDIDMERGSCHSSRSQPPNKAESIQAEVTSMNESMNAEDLANLLNVLDISTFEPLSTPSEKTQTKEPLSSIKSKLEDKALDGLNSQEYVSLLNDLDTSVGPESSTKLQTDDCLDANEYLSFLKELLIDNTNDKDDKKNKVSADEAENERSTETRHSGHDNKSFATKTNESSDERLLDLESLSKEFICSINKRSSNDEDRLAENQAKLLEIQKVEEIRNCKSDADFSQNSIMENWVMAHSKTPVFPLINYNETVFHKEIQTILNSMKISRTFRVQSYAWPYLQRNNSLVLINPRDSGKTWSYLPVICSLVAYRLYNKNKQIPRTYGPLAIILVASCSKAESLYGQCRHLMQAWDGEDIKPVVAIYAQHNDNSGKIHLLNSCGILITTPALLLKIMEINHPQLIDKTRLQHLVFDDIDLMLSRNKDQTETSLKKLINMVMENQTKLPIQLVFTATAWSSWYIPYIKITSDVMLLIGDFLEAAVYSKSSILLSLVAHNEKFNEILKFLKKSSKQKPEEHQDESDKRTIIFCNNDEEVMEVKRLLNVSGYSTVIGTNEAQDNEKYLIEMWKMRDSADILICTDEAFARLQIQDAERIIHYSLSKSWTRFTYRFYAANQVFANLIESNFEHDDKNQQRLSSLILLDDENSLQLPRLIEFMKKHSQVIHADLEKVVQNILYEREWQKVERQEFLCEEYLEFGECSAIQCHFRHNITPLDRLPNNSGIPYSGDLHIAIIKVVSPVHFVARLLEHRPPLSQQWHPVMRSKEFNSFFTFLNLFYSDSNNATLHWPPKIGDLCIYQENQFYRRCRITEIQTKSKSFNIIDDNLLVNIYLIDVGTSIASVKANKLLQIEDKFKDYPAQAVNIRLLNVIPTNGERSWDLETIEMVASWLKVDASTNIRVNIKLAIKNNIWVNDVCVEEFLQFLKWNSLKVNLKKSLIKENFAVHACKESVVIQKANELKCFNYEIDESDDNVKNSTDLKASPPVTNNQDESSLNSLYKEEEEEENCISSPEKSAEECFVPLRKTYEEYLLMKNKKTKKENKKNDNKNKESLMIYQQNETWSTLPLHEVIKVKVHDQKTDGMEWSSFYFQVKDEKHSNLFENLRKIIDEHINTLQKNQIEIDINSLKTKENYILKYNDMYVRAKLLTIEPTTSNDEPSNNYIFFLCDLGEFRVFSELEVISVKHLLYESSTKIIEFTPYQSVHCTLAGVQTDVFCRPFPIVEPFLYIYAVLDNGTKKVSTDLSINSFTVLFFATHHADNFEAATMINQKLIDLGICKIDPKTRHFLSFNLSLNSNLLDQLNLSLEKDFEMGEFQLPIESAATVDKKIDDLIDNVAKDLSVDTIAEDKKQGFLAKAFGGFKHYAYSELIKFISPAKKNEKKEIVKEILEEKCNDSLETHHPTISLKAPFKIPAVTWYETDFLIYILIHVPDIKKYYLHLSNDAIIFSTIVHDEQYGLVLNLLGNIDPSMSSYQIRGLNLAIRATKTVYMSWPRLVKQADKFPWIKYNINAIINNEQAETYPAWLLSHLRSSNYNFEGTSDESEDEEDIKLETYNRIDNFDDLFDFSD